MPNLTELFLGADLFIDGLLLLLVGHTYWLVRARSEMKAPSIEINQYLDEPSDKEN